MSFCHRKLPFMALGYDDGIQDIYVPMNSAPHNKAM